MLTSLPYSAPPGLAALALALALAGCSQLCAVAPFGPPRSQPRREAGCSSLQACNTHRSLDHDDGASLLHPHCRRQSVAREALSLILMWTTVRPAVSVPDCGPSCRGQSVHASPSSKERVGSTWIRVGETGRTRRGRAADERPASRPAFRLRGGAALASAGPSHALRLRRATGPQGVECPSHDPIIHELTNSYSRRTSRPKACPPTRTRT